jgi:thioredoxin-related protein
MQKIILLALGFAIITSSFKDASSEAQKMNWMELKDVVQKLEVEKKPVLIDLYTNWCHWCKVMDKKTYSNPQVISYLEEHFYVAKVDAESKNDISWKNKTYTYNRPYKINDFALYLTQNQPSFPSTIILVDEIPVPIAIPGFMEPKELEMIVKYFGEGAYKSKTFPEFQKTFRASWK